MPKKMVRGELPALTIAEGVGFIAYLDDNPRCDGHTLVVPKEQQARLSELSSASQAELLAGVVEVERRLSTVLGTSQFTVVLQDGGGTDHVHAHVMPRNEGDGGLGIAALWPDVPASPSQERAELQRAALNSLAEQLQGQAPTIEGLAQQLKDAQDAKRRLEDEVRQLRAAAAQTAAAPATPAVPVPEVAAPTAAAAPPPQTAPVASPPAAATPSERPASAAASSASERAARLAAAEAGSSQRRSSKGSLFGTPLGSGVASPAPGISPVASLAPAVASLAPAVAPEAVVVQAPAAPAPAPAPAPASSEGEGSAAAAAAAAATTARRNEDASAGDFVSAVVRGKEQMAEVVKRDATVRPPRLRLSLVGGDTLWVQADAVRRLASADEAEQTRLAWKEAKIAKIQADSEAISVKRF